MNNNTSSIIRPAVLSQDEIYFVFGGECNNSVSYSKDTWLHILAALTVSTATLAIIIWSYHVGQKIPKDLQVDISHKGQFYL